MRKMSFIEDKKMLPLIHLYKETAFYYSLWIHIPISDQLFYYFGEILFIYCFTINDFLLLTTSKITAAIRTAPFTTF